MMAVLGGGLTVKPKAHGLTLQQVGDEPYYRAVKGNPRTMLVLLHAWSSNMEECEPAGTHPLEAVTDCVWVTPNFGGLNNHPQGAGHPAQLERIKRVIDRTLAQYPMVERVILHGKSGGMYTALMLLGAYPGIAYGASLWVGPFDLADWWDKKPQYRDSLQACMGGTPAQVPAQYAQRSPCSASISCVHLFINGSESDTEVPYAHITGARARFAAGNTLPVLPSFAGGHIVIWADAIAQIRSMQPT